MSVFENLYVRSFSMNKTLNHLPSHTDQKMIKLAFFFFSKLMHFLPKTNHNPDSFVYGDFSIDGMKKCYSEIK